MKRFPTIALLATSSNKVSKATAVRTVSEIGASADDAIPFSIYSEATHAEKSLKTTRGPIQNLYAMAQVTTFANALAFGSVPT